MKDVFLITGATGHVGGAAARKLVANGYTVHGVTRNIERVEALPDGVTPVVGDLNDLETVTNLFHGVTSLFLIPGFKHTDKILAVAKEAGVKYVVALSGGAAATGNKANPMIAPLIEIEEAVKKAGIPWTILRPGAFMTNMLSWAGQLKKGDVIRAPFPHLKQGLLDPADIGVVAAAVMAHPELHVGKTYELSGQEQLSNADRVRIMGEALGRPLVYEPYTVEEAREVMSKTLPKAFVQAFFDFHDDGTVYEPELSSTVEELTGKKPRLFRDWVADHSQIFAKE